MNILIILVISLSIFYLGYRFYAKFIEKIFDVDGSHTTPAVEINDGVDYVPTRKFVIFGHHFSSIAGGGPIIGPCVGIIFGYLPVWIWIVIGTVLIGAVHDYTALLASMREKGRSMAEIAEKTFGRSGFLLFIGFTVIMLLMVTSVFLNLTTTALSSKYPLSHFGVTDVAIKTVVENGVRYAVVGGIASTSVIIITLFAPFIGFLLYKKKANIFLISILAIVVCIIGIQVGIYFPIQVDSLTWMIVLSVYTLIAAGIPVWIILQPRDFSNSFLLYGGIFGLILGIVVLGVQGTEMSAPALNIKEGSAKLGSMWPILFITVACGAISGFHALVAGGTSSKQIMKELPDAKTVGYGGMILEAVLALGVIIALSTGIEFQKAICIVFPCETGAKANPILAFALGMGGLLNKSLGLPLIYGAIFGILMVEGFVVTTLDTAVRLNRYLFEELWRILFKGKVPKLLNTYIVNSFICVVLMFTLAYFNVFVQLWKLFGTANQLLASLTLLTISLWLLKKGKKYLFVFIPGIFMFITTLASLLIILFKQYIPNKNYMLSAGDIVLVSLSLGLVVLIIKNFIKRKRTEQ